MKATQSSQPPVKTRGITVNNRKFYWFVAVDAHAPDVTCMHALNILSENRQFMVRYHLNQADPRTRHITVLGPEFGGKRPRTSLVRRYLAPDWLPDASLKGRHLADLISWCLSGKEEKIEVDINGLPKPGSSLGTKLLTIAPALINRVKEKWPGHCEHSMAGAAGLT